ncbi:hypothetical protein [Allomuricauda sp. d1]|uniref:Nmad2 family putative nucleotide modification protein n=1 Tax=Allomuricauda sp. d1 TaxID=3136725 RepID=UPI0031CF7F15
MNFFSYKVEHDYGLAPNPFGKYCTLAVCKPSIRKNKNLSIGDWVIGTGTRNLNRINHLIYAMRVSERLTFNEYWRDIRFSYKKPNVNGSLVQIFGDNFYHKNENSVWTQEISAHSFVDKEKHTQTDTSGENVLISEEFYYLGRKSRLIPVGLREICNKGRDMKYKGISEELGLEFISWVKSNFDIGINADPINWIDFENEMNQLTLFD